MVRELTRVEDLFTINMDQGSEGRDTLKILHDWSFCFTSSSPLPLHQYYYYFLNKRVYYIWSLWFPDTHTNKHTHFFLSSPHLSLISFLSKTLATIKIGRRRHHTAGHHHSRPPFSNSPSLDLLDLLAPYFSCLLEFSCPFLVKTKVR